MSYYKEITCVRCGTRGSEKTYYTGCPVCAQKGEPVNFKTVYEFDKNAAEVFKTGSGKGLFKHKEFLPLKPHSKLISIGEGNTDLHHCENLGKKLGFSTLYIKNESQNPTWSYKDRLSAVGVSKALEMGAPVVTASSTGNHGAAVAAYAAAAGLPCVIFTVPEVPETMKTLMQSYGAFVFATPKPIDRWTIMRWCVDNLGWLPLSGFISPPVGSVCFGVDGYKTIAYEIFEELGDLPDCISVPSIYSDGLYGIYKGIEDLHTIGLTKKSTKMVAAEAFGSIKKTLENGAAYPVSVEAGQTVSFSIGGARNTYQGLEAVTKSGGWGQSSNDEETLAMQMLLSKTEGIYAEASSVTGLVALVKLLKEKRISADDVVVSIITSTGLKDTKTTASQLCEVPVIAPEYAVLKAKIKQLYNFNI